jgi:D-alanine--poly(phosphoribitol) ligase subunit 1
MSYLVPFLKGACVYTVPNNKIKYGCIVELLEEQRLTIALMVPSVLHYLRPYFEEINFPDMRYSLLCGEALPLDLTDDWSRCVPNSKIINVYGPTEDTVFCTHYNFNRNKQNKSYNGILSIGKSMEGTDMIIVDENNKILSSNKSGELCLSGRQLTPGYWNNEIKNKEAFFEIEYKDKLTKFYKTGDLCSSDDDGDFFYLGRLDHQVKIQGFRVELSEIEFHCKTYLDKLNVIALAYSNKTGNTEIGLAIESSDFDTDGLLEFIKVKIPGYMIPSKIRFIKPFPLNVNGKTDRKVLSQIY